MNRRGELPEIPEPMRASPDVIDMCRAAIDSRWKAFVRRWCNKVLGRMNNLGEIGEGFQLNFFTRLPAGSRLGRYAYIGSGFSSPSPVSVGDLCMISTNVTLVGNDHGIRNVCLPTRLDFQWHHSVTVFEGDVWVGHGSIIRTGISIGRGAVIAAGSVVVKDVDPYTVVGGNPARLIRKRFSDEAVIVHDKLLYGDLSERA